MTTRKRNLPLLSPGVSSNIKISLVLVLWGKLEESLCPRLLFLT